jgi:phthiocerol/phenolphthiocerol synthesis type-I polyketide synthase E
MKIIAEDWTIKSNVLIVGVLNPCAHGRELTLMIQLKARTSTQHGSTESTRRNFELFRIASRDAEEFETHRTWLATKIQAGSWEGGILGQGAFRYGFAAADAQQALDLLAAGSASEVRDSVSARQPVTACIFPGLGGELFDRFEELTALGDSFNDVIAQASEITTVRLGANVTELVRRYAGRSPGRSGERRLLREPTAKAQPPTAVSHAILYTIECALMRIWLDWGVRPQYVGGYSLGEYSAACAAGLFSFDVGLSIVIDRALMLSALPKSGMIAVSAHQGDLPRLSQLDLHLVAENSAEQTILGGTRPALERATQSLRAAGYIVHELPVEYAFHTPLMASLADKLATLFASVETRAPVLQLVSTMTGELIDSARLRDPAHWVHHLCQPVRFLETIDALVRLNTGIFLEVGPGQALSPLIESHLRHRTGVMVVASMPSDYDSRSTPEYLLSTAARLWTIGVQLGNIPVIRVDEPTASSSSAAVSATVDDPTILRIQDIWCDVLHRDLIGPDDNLFDLGGNSLQTARIAMRIKRQFNIELSLRDIYSAPTPRRLAGIISTGCRLQNAEDLITLPNGLSIRCQSRAEARYFYQTIFEERSYLRHGLRIDPGATVLDVGANIGIFSMFAALEAPGIRLYSFEPVRPLFDMLRSNLVDLCDDATLLNSGISDTTGESVITYYPNSPGMSSFQADRADEETVLRAILHNSHAMGDREAGAVLADRADFMDARFQAMRMRCPMRTLSEIIDEHDLSVVDLLKIDVQKLEMQVLGGIAERHWSRIRQIVIEIHDRLGRMSDAHALLSAQGFAVKIEQDTLYRSTNIYNLYASR